MAQFSESAAQALSVIRNAIRAEFQEETDLVLDIELLEYRFTVDTLHSLERPRGLTLAPRRLVPTDPEPERRQT